MEKLPTELPHPPGVIRSLQTGFDAVARHFTVLLIPILLDILLWLAPRLSTGDLWKAGLVTFGNAVVLTGADGTSVERFRELMLEAQNFNMLTMLSTFPIGISSLMASKQPTQSPLGEPLIIQVPTIQHFLGWLVILVLLGWVLGAIYYQWISGITLQKTVHPGNDNLRAIVNTLFLLMIWTVVLMALILPVTFLASILMLINSPMLVQAALIFFGITAVWLAVPVFFSPHGIFIRRQSALASLLSSLRLARYTLPNSGLFIMTLFIFGQGFTILWSVPRDNSWLVMAGIFGHAFISTALLSASFVYYQDMTSWLQVAIERLNSQPGSNRV
ncbi:MAG: hypothetical protein JXA13_02535 [Anaerolineales bacterium]|nr:hypothetical protein [Anaerolineales bacterium]